MDFVVARDGTVRTLYTEDLDLTALGRLHISRASSVEPDARGRWTADLGPVLGPFAPRGKALAAEIAWLQAHRLAPTS